MKNRFFLSLFLILMVAFGPLIHAAEPVFSDVEGHKHKAAIEYVQTRGLVQGYDDGTFKPDQLIQRDEFAKILVEALYEPQDYEKYTTESCFNDIPAGEWYTKYVCFAKAKGIISGYPGGNFEPTKKINFIESLKVVLESYESAGWTDLGLRDVNPEPWYKPYNDYVEKADSACRKAQDAGSFHAFGCLSLWGNVALDQQITRAETAVIIQWMALYNQ